jgi:membrane-associated phospholipid phosphatase
VKIALWAWVAVTALGTVYLGWHYVIDDLAGVVIAVVALALARVLTGLDLRSERRLRGMVGVKGRPDAIRV